MSKFEDELNALIDKKQTTAVVDSDPTLESKERELKEDRTNRNYSRLKKTQAELEKLKNLNLRTLPSNYFEDLAKQAEEMRLAQTDSLPALPQV